MSIADPAQLQKLYRNLLQTFNESELETLCFELAFSYEDLAGQERTEKCRELILFLGRRGLLGDLLALVKQKRPNVDWPYLTNDMEIAGKDDWPAGVQTEPNDSEEGPRRAGATEASPPSQRKKGHTFNIGNVGEVGFMDVGGRKIASGDMHFNVDMSGTRNVLSGTVYGANINSTLESVTQSIGAASQLDAASKEQLQELQDLIRQLNEALQQVSVEKAEDAEAVAEITHSLVEMSGHENPNKTMIKVTADGLKKAAKNLGDLVPIVLPIATRIADQIIKVFG